MSPIQSPPSTDAGAAPARSGPILGLGAVAVDDLIFVETFPVADSKVRVLETARHGGGLTATALVAAARLGVPCAYAGVLGTDDLSQFAAQLMRSEGIDLFGARLSPEARIFHSRIVVSTREGSRTIFSDGRHVIGAAPDWPPREQIASASVLFVDHVGIPGMLRAAKIASELGIPIVGDLERDSGPGFKELCSLVDHFIVSEQFACELTGAPDAATAVHALASKARGVVAVTAGTKGCWYVSAETRGAIRHQRAFSVRVVDTTGCGDVFHGAYAAALSLGYPVEERFRMASAAAALKATAPGGQAGAPTRSALQAFLSTNH